MATAWQTLEEAALTLGISSRTLHRRLARGEFDTRMENGRREVLVVIDEPRPNPANRLPADPPAPELHNESSFAASEAPAEAPDTSDVSDVSDVSEESEESDDVGHAMLTLHEDRIRRTDLAIMAYQQSVNVAAADARRAHFRTRLAWSVTGGLTVMAFVAAIWGTHTVTRAKGEVQHLSEVVQRMSDTAQSNFAEVERLRQDAETAKITAARAEGQLEAARGRIEQLETSAKALTAGYSTPQPSTATTQPVSANPQPLTQLDGLIERITLK